MLQTDNVVFVLIDVQGNLALAMHNKDTLLDNLKKLIQGLHILNIPIIVTEQYPKGLGATLPELAALLPPHTPTLSKIHFSCCGDDTFVQTLAAHHRRQVLVAGIEAHVCVYQTTADLLQRGYAVEIVTDAISSRTADNRELGLAKMQQLGAGITSVEMALFELMGIAGGDQFKQIQKIIK
jgi:nicotinamidase-related amidase